MVRVLLDVPVVPNSQSVGTLMPGELRLLNYSDLLVGIPNGNPLKIPLSNLTGSVSWYNISGNTLTVTGSVGEVYVNGILQKINEHYTVVGNQIIFTSNLSLSDNIAVVSGASINELALIPPINNLASSGSVNLVTNTVNRAILSGDITFVLPSVSSSIYNQILVQLSFSQVYTINLGAAVYFSGSAPDLSVPGSYNIIYEHDGTNWVVGSIRKA